MNLYEFHNKPETLKYHKFALKQIPPVFFKDMYDNEEWDELAKREKSIAKYPDAAIDYIFSVKKGPWPEAEDAIAGDAFYAFIYANDILNGPFPKGEDVIAREDYTAYKYARNIIKGRWPKGEKAIMGSTFQRQYENFLKRTGK